MNRYFEVNEKFELKLRQMKDLEEEYQDKIKGETYKYKKGQIIKDLNDLKRQALAIGSFGNICHVHGVRQRPHRKNNQLMIKESFNLYFVNIHEDDANALVKLHVKNAVSYTIKFIRPGMLIIP